MCSSSGEDGKKTTYKPGYTRGVQGGRVSQGVPGGYIRVLGDLSALLTLFLGVLGGLSGSFNTVSRVLGG